MIPTINTAVNPTESKLPLVNQNLGNTTTTNNSPTTAQQDETAATPAVELSSPVDRAYAVLSHEVTVELNLVFASFNIPSSSAPEAVNNQTNNAADNTVDNVLNSVSSAANTVDGQQRKALLSQAHDGVDRGITEAKDVLHNQGVLSAQVYSKISATQQSVHKGISNLETTTDNSALVVSDSAFIATSSTLVDQGDIQIQTNDGDTIRISFNQSQQNSQMMFANSDANGSSFGMASAQSSSASYSFSIDGQLDEGEREALGKLTHGIDELVDKFFSGELNDAFEKMGDLKFNSNELSGLAIQLSHTESHIAIGAYQKVQALNTPATDNTVAVSDAPATTTPATETVTHPVTAPANPEPAVVTAVEPAPVTPPTTVAEVSPISNNPVAVTPVTNSVASTGLSAFDSFVSEVRQLITDLNDLDIFSAPETIAVDLFEGLSKSKGHDEHVSNLALDQFKQVLGFLSEEDDHAEESDDDKNHNNENSDVQTQLL